MSPTYSFSQRDQTRLRVAVKGKEEKVIDSCFSVLQIKSVSMKYIRRKLLGRLGSNIMPKDNF